MKFSHFLLLCGLAGFVLTYQRLKELKEFETSLKEIQELLGAIQEARHAGRSIEEIIKAVNSRC